MDDVLVMTYIRYFVLTCFHLKAIFAVGSIDLRRLRRAFEVGEVHTIWIPRYIVYPFTLNHRECTQLTLSLYLIIIRASVPLGACASARLNRPTTAANLYQHTQASANPYIDSHAKSPILPPDLSFGHFSGPFSCM